jgi:hypothetical protein
VSSSFSPQKVLTLKEKFTRLNRTCQSLFVVFKKKKWILICVAGNYAPLPMNGFVARLANEIALGHFVHQICYVVTGRLTYHRPYGSYFLGWIPVVELQIPLVVGVSALGTTR